MGYTSTGFWNTSADTTDCTSAPKTSDTTAFMVKKLCESPASQSNPTLVPPPTNSTNRRSNLPRRTTKGINHKPPTSDPRMTAKQKFSKTILSPAYPRPESLNFADQYSSQNPIMMNRDAISLTRFHALGRTHSRATEPFELHSSFVRGHRHRRAFPPEILEFPRITSNAA